VDDVSLEGEMVDGSGRDIPFEAGVGRNQTRPDFSYRGDTMRKKRLVILKRKRM
jgi:hypothetical protein